MEEIMVKCRRTEWCESIDFAIFTRTSVAKPIVMIPYNVGETVEPTFTLTNFECQALMDSLYKLGYRPADGKYIGGELIAVREHLNDLRKVITAKLNIPLSR